MGCVQCGRDVEAAFRFCPWCGAVQRRKLVEFFTGHRTLDPGRALRVSRYLRTTEQEPHVRFSVWDRDGRARAVVSLEEDEAQRLGEFLRPLPRTRRLRDAIESLIYSSR